jgi:hypothetical protein
VGEIRIPFFWEDIQPINGLHFDWSKYDRTVREAARRGIRVQPFVMGVPRWLRESRPRGVYPPLDDEALAAWRAFLGAAVDRYGRGGSFWSGLSLQEPAVPEMPVESWQIWNEPNAESYFRPRQGAPQRYALLLAESAETVRAHDAGALVIAAGMFVTPPDGIRMQRFLRRLYRVEGAAASFDAAALHPYAPNVKRSLNQLRSGRRIMERNGDGDKPLWVTELGWPTLAEMGNGSFVTTERGQRKRLSLSFRRILRLREEWRIDRLVWYTWRDNDLFDGCNLCRSSGLFREDLTPKPAWRAFVRFTGGSP